MITINFPQHMRVWIAQSKGELSPAKFLFKIIEAHYYNTISHKENNVGTNKNKAGAEPLSEGVLPSDDGKPCHQP